jgi:hypothetical protein
MVRDLVEQSRGAKAKEIKEKCPRAPYEASLFGDS